jgi:hypothetical protein
MNSAKLLGIIINWDLNCVIVYGLIHWTMELGKVICGCIHHVEFKPVLSSSYTK